MKSTKTADEEKRRMESHDYFANSEENLPVNETVVPINTRKPSNFSGLSRRSRGARATTQPSRQSTNLFNETGLQKGGGAQSSSSWLPPGQRPLSVGLLNKVTGGKTDTTRSQTGKPGEGTSRIIPVHKNRSETQHKNQIEQSFEARRTNNTWNRAPKQTNRCRSKGCHTKPNPGRAGGFMSQDQMKCTAPDAERAEHLALLLRPFVLGNEDQYRLETPPPIQTAPRVPKGKMYAFETIERFDLGGNLISTEHTAYEYEIGDSNDPIVLID